jgi:hypothetical protein
MDSEKAKAAAALQQMAGPPIPYATPAKYTPAPVPPPAVVYVAKTPSGFSFGFGCTFGVLVAVITIIFLIKLTPAMLSWIPHSSSSTVQQPIAPSSSPPSPSAQDVDAVDNSGMTALHRAARDGDVQAARDLIARGADINKRADNRWTPLHTAARYENTEIIKILIDAGADANAKVGGYTPLGIAQFHHKSKAVKLLSANAP